MNSTVPLRLCVRRTATAPPPGERALGISLRVPSELEVVEEAIEVIARHCVSCGIPPRMVSFKVRVALSEALTNAIVYGNRMDPQKQVNVRIDIKPQRVQMFIEDQGEGFDPAAIPNPTTPDRVQREDGRGLFLIRQLMDDVIFNERGNTICMVLHCA